MIVDKDLSASRVTRKGIAGGRGEGDAERADAQLGLTARPQARRIAARARVRD